MLIEENTVKAAAAVTAYRRGAIEAGGEIWAQPIVLKSDAITLMADKMPYELRISDFFQTASDEALPEVIIIGTGAKQEFIHPKIIAEAASRGVGLECMNTASACRTLVLLQGEGRNVWAWLWP
ncbi:MTH938/NDUFAF3 family protein [Neisseria yangbaofengii]|uniref:MTH938/NDUFAF3 family protein n=1 Tax=Neisseria yangbaofengii TaxID=2709396 RepID=UPI0013ECF367|nr:MTH938/NDUFAF3 family protein [Neisseria yangbaofengii]